MPGSGVTLSWAFVTMGVQQVAAIVSERFYFVLRVRLAFSDSLGPLSELFGALLEPFWGSEKPKEATVRPKQYHKRTQNTTRTPTTHNTHKKSKTNKNNNKNKNNSNNLRAGICSRQLSNNI